MEKVLNIFKVLGDENRLKIIENLSDRELCACKLLEKLNITQPTLSHHMKLLMQCGLVNGRKDGKWSYYSLNKHTIELITGYLNNLGK